MNKEDVLWAAIRIFGIFLLVMAIMQIPKLLKSSMTSYIYSGYESTLSSLPETQSDFNIDEVFSKAFNKLFSKSISDAILSVINIIIYSLAGLYFLRKGDFVFKLVSNKPFDQQDKTITDNDKPHEA